MGEAKKKGRFLKVIIVQKFITGIIEIVLAFGILRFAGKDLAEMVRNAAFYLRNRRGKQFHSRDSHESRSPARQYHPRRFGKPFPLRRPRAPRSIRPSHEEEMGRVAHRHIHSLFIPYEIWILIAHPSIIKLSILVFNCAIVYYLAKHKELFRKRRAETAVRPAFYSFT